MEPMSGQSTQQELKKKRLAEQLRQNLKRRKGQSRATRSGKADQTSGLPAAHNEDQSKHSGGNQSD
ncbi:MAG: hypothetical protein JJ858_18950 [Rhizobiaceae bacterium]|jgi:hypothetical protein|nr:hypothetical protein [Rhizobiaceae bacterium]